MTLLKESRLNHMGKLAFRWVYWNVLLPGRDIPGVGAQMQMRGKRRRPPRAYAGDRHGDHDDALPPAPSTSTPRAS